MWSGVTVSASGRVGMRATQELLLSQCRMPQTLVFTAQSQNLHCKYQRLHLVQTEGTAEMGKTFWVVYVGGQVAERDREDKLHEELQRWWIWDY